MSKTARAILATCAFIVVNLSLTALPAAAGWRVGTCIGDDGQEKLCCHSCFIICNCDPDEVVVVE